jgi:hypothetical protein
MGRIPNSIWRCDSSGKADYNRQGDHWQCKTAMAVHVSDNGASGSYLNVKRHTALLGERVQHSASTTYQRTLDELGTRKPQHPSRL